MNSLKTWILAGLSGLLAAPAAALAEAGRPVNWQMNLQDPVTPVAEFIQSFHNWTLIIVTIITLFVMVLLLYVMVKFNSKANPVPSKTTHHSLLEVVWTLVPVLVLAGIAIPSFKLLFMQRVIPKSDMVVKVIGNPSWNWTYEYPDLGVNDDKSAKVSFTSFLLPEEKAKAAGVPYLLATDVPMVVPVNKVVKLIVTADPEGIIHSWTIPSFGMQINAIPGRLNEDWFKVTKEGVYYGQCEELCGKDHAYMPIEVWAVNDANYKKWADFELSPPRGSKEEVEKKTKELFDSIHPASSKVASN